MSECRDKELKKKSQTLREILAFIDQYRKEFKEPVQLSVINRKFGKRCAPYGGVSQVVNHLEAQGLVFVEMTRNGSLFVSLEKLGEPLSLRLVKG
jgi:hypothetical protein